MGKFDLNIHDFEMEMEKLFELQKNCEKSDYKSADYEKYEAQARKIRDLKLDFAFILKMVELSPHGAKVLYWYNEWQRMGRDLPLRFMTMNGLVK